MCLAESSDVSVTVHAARYGVDVWVGRGSTGSRTGKKRHRYGGALSISYGPFSRDERRTPRRAAVRARPCWNSPPLGTSENLRARVVRGKLSVSARYYSRRTTTVTANVISLIEVYGAPVSPHVGPPSTYTCMARARVYENAAGTAVLSVPHRGRGGGV